MMGQNMHGVAREYSDALNREITYADIPPEEWERELKKVGLPEHLTKQLATMAELNRAGRYDRLAGGVQRVRSRRTGTGERPGNCRAAGPGLRLVYPNTPGSTHPFHPLNFLAYQRV
jgi:hypothetical protein